LTLNYSTVICYSPDDRHDIAETSGLHPSFAYGSEFVRPRTYDLLTVISCKCYSELVYRIWTFWAFNFCVPSSDVLERQTDKQHAYSIIYLIHRNAQQCAVCHSIQEAQLSRETARRCML